MDPASPDFQCVSIPPAQVAFHCGPIRCALDQSFEPGLAKAAQNHRRERPWKWFVRVQDEPGIVYQHWACEQLTHCARFMGEGLSLIHISEPTRLLSISYAV